DVVVIRGVAGVGIGYEVRIFGGGQDVNAHFIAAVDLEAEDDFIGGLAVGRRLRVTGHHQFIRSGSGNFSADLSVLPAQVLGGEAVSAEHVTHLDDRLLGDQHDAGGVGAAALGEKSVIAGRVVYSLIYIAQWVIGSRTR